MWHCFSRVPKILKEMLVRKSSVFDFRKHLSVPEGKKIATAHAPWATRPSLQFSITRVTYNNYKSVHIHSYLIIWTAHTHTHTRLDWILINANMIHLASPFRGHQGNSYMPLLSQQKVLSVWICTFSPCSCGFSTTVQRNATRLTRDNECPVDATHQCRLPSPRVSSRWM